MMTLLLIVVIALSVIALVWVFPIYYSRHTRRKWQAQAVERDRKIQTLNETGDQVNTDVFPPKGNGQSHK